MKKWIGPFFSLLLTLSLISLPGLFQDSQRPPEATGKRGVVMAQNRAEAQRKGEKDTFLIDLLKQLKQTVDGWLKSINDEIEREDVTRFKVRFLEILRSILEWVKQKIDAWLENLEEASWRREVPLDKETASSLEAKREGAVGFQSFRMRVF